MGKKLFLRGAALLSASALASRLLGLYRDHLLAGTFGALNGKGIFNLDTYYAAFRLPDLLYNLLIYGALSAALVPLLTDYLERGKKEESFRFLSAVFNLGIIFMLGISLLAFALAPFIIPIITPGFSEAMQSQTVALARIMLLSPIFFTGSSVLQGIQISHQRFTGYSLAPIMYNVSIIVSTFLFAETHGAYGVAWGVAAGAFLHMLVQIPILGRIGFSWSALFDFRRNDIRTLITLTIPRIIGLAASQFMLIIETVIASTLGVGAIAILNYAQNLQHVPIGLIGIPAAIAGFGTLSSLAAQEKFEELRETIRRHIVAVYALIIPATVGMILLRFEVVHLVLLNGKFTESDVALTANTLALLTIGLAGTSIVFLLARSFYALQDTKTPLYASLAAMLVHVTLAIILTQEMAVGIYGIAMANSIAALLNAAILGWKLRGKIGSVIEGATVRKLLIAALLMGLIISALQNVLSYSSMQTATAALLNMVILTLTGALSYFGLLRVMGIKAREVFRG